MGTTISRRIASVAAAAAVGGLVLAGCSTDDGSSDAEGTTSAMATSSAMASSSETSAMEAEPASLVGPGCADYAEANPDIVIPALRLGDDNQEP